MSTQDKWISIGIVLIILIHLAIWLTGYFTGRISYLFSYLNLGFGISILAYWIIQQLSVQQHIFDLREIIVLIFEVIVTACALYNILSVHHYKALKIFQYIVFGIDLMVLTAALIFMLTFKMTKLF